MFHSPLLQQRQSPARFTSAPDHEVHFHISTLDTMSRRYDRHPDRLSRTDEMAMRISFYEIIWFRSGSGHLWIDTRPYDQCSNMIYFLVPGQFRRFALEGEVRGYRIQFSPAILYRSDAVPRVIQALNAYHHSPSVVVDAELQYEMEYIFQKMIKEFSNCNLLQSEILAGLLSVLLVHFSRRLPVTENIPVMSRDNLLLKNFLQLVQEHFANKKQVTDYASELCVTPNYLNRTVKKITGFTASHHIQQQIILEAKRKAIHSGRSMKEIAYHLGFDNLAHFSKFFKNNSGTSFSNFRKQVSIAQ